MKIHKSYLNIFLVLFLVILPLIALPASPARAFADGPYDPDSGTNLTSIGTEAWQNPGEVAAPGSPYATVSLYQFHTSSNYLYGSQYGFAVPPDASIQGIEVTIARMVDGRPPSIFDTSVQLVKTVNPVGDNKALGTAWPTSFTVATYGGPTDLWGETWTPAEINADSFGVVLAVQRDNNGNNTRVASVDSMRISVYYSYIATMEVVCGDGTPLVYGESVLCVATVSKVGGDQTPSGTVSWSSDTFGSFPPDPCSLVGSNGVSSCSVIYTPRTVGSGTHTITGSYSGDSYFVANQAVDSVSVSPRPVTVTANTQTKVYGEDDPVFDFEITAGSLVFSDTFTGTLTREPGEDVNQYPILQGTLALSDNYDLTYLGDYLTITTRPLTVTANPQTKVYGEDDPVFDYEITAGSLAFSDTFTGTLTREPGEDVNQYPILQGTLALSDNYDLTYLGDYLTITTRFVTVTANSQTKEYGNEDPIFDYEITAGSLAFTDTFTGTLTREPGEDVGQYPILQGTLGLSNNYDLAFVSDYLTITLRSVTVTADAQSKVVGSTDPGLTYQLTSGSLLSGDVFSGDLTRQPGERVGTYPILQGTLSLADYYDLTFVGADFSITGYRLPLPLIIR